MRRMVAMALAVLALGGCVNADTTMHAPNGQTALCSGVAFGIIASVVTYAEYRKCVDFYKAAGFTRENSSDTAPLGQTAEQPAGISMKSVGVPQEKIAATGTQDKASAIDAGMQEALARVKACLAEVNANPRFLDVVVGMVPANAHVTDTGYPSARAAAEIAPWWAAARQCETAYAAALRTLVPAYGAVIDTEITGQDAHFGGVAARKPVTWGTLARGTIRVQTEATWQLQVAMNREAAALQKETGPKP